MAKKPKLDEVKFEAELNQNVSTESVRNAIRELLEFGRVYAEALVQGTAKLGSFNYAIAVGNKNVNLFTVYNSGKVSISFENFSLLVPNRFTRTLYNRLVSLPGFMHVENYEKFPSFLIEDTLVKPDVMTSFQSAIREFQDGIAAF